MNIPQQDDTLVAAITGGIWTIVNNSFAAAALGRVVWHLQKVQKGERRFFEPGALITEFAGVLFGYMAGMGLAAIIGLDGDAARGLVLIVSYLGPDGAAALIDRYLQGKRT